MIPHTLQIKNFLSYGDELQTIDFSSYQLICLSGKNGHGKSALLDAITWALWGNARKTSGTSKADAGLLRLGQTHMMVIFDFELSGVMYRVKREFALAHSKPYANLEFGVVDIQTGAFNSLTDKKIKKTQDKIEQTLHLNFESFSNSAFLRQGNANEFSKKSSKERKDVLATILGLDQYETLRKRASEKAKHALLEQKTLQAFQEKLTQELTQKDELNKKIKDGQVQLKEVESLEKEHAQEQAALENKKNTLAKKQKERDALQFQKDTVHKEQQRILEQAHAIQDAWRSTHHKQLGLPDRAILEKRKTSLTAEIKLHQEKFQKGLQLKEQYLAAKEHLQTLEQKHLLKHNTIIQRLQLERERTLTEQKAAKQSHATITKKITEMRAQITTPKNKDTASLATLDAQFEKRKAQYQQWVAQGNWLREQQTQLKQKNSLTQDENDPSCPLCEQNLSASRKRFLRQKFDGEQHRIAHQLKRLSGAIKRLKELLIIQHEHIQKIRSEQELTAQLLIAEKERSDLSKTIAERTKTLQAHDKSLTQTVEDAKKSLIENADYQTITTKIDNLKKEAIIIKYDPTKHKDAQTELTAIEQQLLQCTTIEKEAGLQKNRLETFDEQRRCYKEQCKKNTQLTTALKQFENLTAIEKELAQKQTALAQKTSEIARKKETLLEEKGRLQNQAGTLKQYEQELKSHTKNIATLTREIEDLQTIATATGKNGLQALLIEEAIPEIENEANELLAKLTDNQAQIFIESLRDLKKGGTKETLDIKISDSAGIRPYELFSGGEAFRIDFALRIAISKLLARRAGTALQTLIIDEGFGSQDEEGLANIMDAIYKVQDDFCKVIIVSHLPAMKDSFPVHFVVQKGAQGSRVSVVEHG